jgi:3',5'-cyclic AMP phosphodiesterase CpdA
LERIRKLGFPTINILGNHDVPRDNLLDVRFFEKYFGPPYFYFDYQNARFIILNNSAHEFGDGQRAWLDKTLAEAKGRLKFVFMHIPTFNHSRRKSYLIKWDEDYKPFEQIIQRHKVDILFTGHLHLLYDTIYQGTRTIITGGAGAPLYEVPEKGGVYHWIKVRVKANTVLAEPVIIPTPSWLRLIYRTVFFFNYEIRDHWKVYLLVFAVAIFLLSIFLLKIRRERGKKGNQ